MQMIKVENSMVMIGVHGSDEIKKDYTEIVRAICLYHIHDEHMSEDDAKQKVMDLTERALKFNTAVPEKHMQASDWVARMMREIFDGGPSCT